ncbi:hypothetical protein [uncultured Gammaproteobacteria bacterium]|nr:hypothetical protein [uncultured Gammaproteobacteria bacterium]
MFFNLPPHRWLRNGTEQWVQSATDLPPHRWLRKTLAFVTM